MVMKSNSSSFQYVAIPMGSQPPEQSSSAAATAAQSFNNEDVRSVRRILRKGKKNNCAQIWGKWLFLFFISSLMCFMFPLFTLSIVLYAMISPKVVHQPPLSFIKYHLIKPISIIQKLDDLYKKRDVTRGVVIHICLAVIATIASVFFGILYKRKSFLGFSVWKWMIMIFAITVGRQIITLISIGFHYTRWSIMRSKSMRFIYNRVESITVCYYLFWLINPTLTVLYSVSLNLIWGQLFSSKNNDDQQVSIVSWTFVCFSIGSVLFAVKAFLLLKWRADMVYKRFMKRILQSEPQLNFFTRFYGLRLTVIDIGVVLNERLLGKKAHGQEDRRRASGCINYMISDHVESENPSLFYLQEIAQHFQDIALASSTRDDDLEDKDEELWESCCQKAQQDVTFTNVEDFLINRLGLKIEEAPEFMQELKEAAEFMQTLETSPEVILESFYNWMVNVRDNILDLGYTLLDAEDLVNYLNKIMNAVIAAIVITTWLLVTGVASYKLLALIASPFVAAAFIFGDMLKRVFEGIIFTFVSHPFIIGDRCIIDGNTLAVKQMGIMRTRFSRVGTKENFSYSNSELASKAIINVSGDSGGDDHVELNLDAATITKYSIDDLRKRIKRYLQEDDGIRFTDYLDVTVKELGSDVKMTVSYQHKIIRGVPAMKRLDRQNKHRAKFLEDLNEMLLQAQIKYADSS